MWIIRPNNSYIIPTSTPTTTPTNTTTPTTTNTPTATSPALTPSITPTVTSTITSTATPTPTLSLTATLTVTPSQTLTPTNTQTTTPTLTLTNTASNTPTLTVTATPTPTNTVTSTITNTPSSTVTNTPSNTCSYTPTPTNTATVSYTATKTPTPTYVYPSIGINSANYNYGADWAGNDGNVTTVGTNGGPSSYGTYDQCGNVWEWTEGTFFGTNRGIRGGSWRSGSNTLKSNYSNSTRSTNKYHNIGFRIASVNNSNGFINYLSISNTGNSPDSTGYGSVSYDYMINRFNITNSEYVEFLNAIAATSDSNELYNRLMTSDPRGGIDRTIANNTYTYSIKTLPSPTTPSIAMSNKPVNFVSWFDCARYCNWLHNNKPFGLQNGFTTENGAYTLNGINSGTDISRNSQAKYFIPNENEWHKTAYYNKNNSSYYLYPTQSNIDPGLISANNSGNGIQT